jgi:hypothetical protein
VRAACAAKGTPFDGALAAEDWFGGPVAQLRGLRLLAGTLERIARGGVAAAIPSRVRTLPTGQLAVDVLPADWRDRLLFAGVRGEVWLPAGTTHGRTGAQVAALYGSDPRAHGLVPGVAVVLGAGNVAAIGPLDVVHKLFVEGQVAVLKFNPVNAYLGPFFEQAFADLIRDGYVATAYGGADVGGHLTNPRAGRERPHHGQPPDARRDRMGHRRGGDPPPCRGASEAHEADHERARQRHAGARGAGRLVRPRPAHAGRARGDADDAEWRLQLHRCEGDRPARGVAAARGVPRRAARRAPHAPGAPGLLSGRGRSVGALHRRAPGVRGVGHAPARGSSRRRSSRPRPGGPVGARLPRGVVLRGDRAWWRSRVATPPTSSTAPSRSPTARSTARSAPCILVDPATERALGPALERAIAALRYGTVGVNVWPAIAFALGATPWGAYPGHTLADVGSGIGTVHDPLLLGRTEKSVVRGPVPRAPAAAGVRHQPARAPRGRGTRGRRGGRRAGLGAAGGARRVVTRSPTGGDRRSTSWVARSTSA